MWSINKKGITSIEILICFTITAVLVISMFKVIDSYKDRQDLESYKNTITTYKNSLTKRIEDAIIENRGVIKAEVVANSEAVPNQIPENQYQIRLTFRNNKVIIMTVMKDAYCTDGQPCDPTKRKPDELDYERSSFYVIFDGEKITLPKAYFLQFNEVYLKNEDDFITLHIGIHHPDLGNKYDVLNVFTPLVSAYPNALGL